MPLALSIIIPAHNESTRIEEGYRRLRPVLDDLDADTIEVIVVDDGSSDDTGRVAAEIYGQLRHSLVVRQEVNLGKGAAVRLGISVARGEKVVVADADMAISPGHLPAILDALENSSLAFGSRAIDGSIHYDTKLRTWAGAAFNALVRHEVGTTLRDTQCGFKGFRLGEARLLAALGMLDGFAYDVELLYLARALDREVATVVVTWDDVVGSSVHLARDSRRMLRDIRGIRRTHYECPVVRVDREIDLDRVGALARASRAQGLVVAHSANDAMIVLPRSAVMAGVELATQLHGQLGVASPAELAGRRLSAL